MTPFTVPVIVCGPSGADTYWRSAVRVDGPFSTADRFEYDDVARVVIAWIRSGGADDWKNDQNPYRPRPDDWVTTSQPGSNAGATGGVPCDGNQKRVAI